MFENYIRKRRMQEIKLRGRCLRVRGGRGEIKEIKLREKCLKVRKCKR
jgi:hypothetical protein